MIDLDAIRANIPKWGGGDLIALVAEVERERAAVVAWLRDNEDAWSMPTWQLADAIERGEHRG